MEGNQDGNSVNPRSLVTEENVRIVLRADKGKDAVLESFEVVDFTKPGDNFVTYVTSVQVRYSLQGNASDVSYVVKLNPCRRIKEMDEYNEIAFGRESGVYLELLPEVNSLLEEIGLEPLRLPRGIHSSLETSKQQLYLVDMRPLGFKLFDKRLGMDVAHATLVLQELGRFHASSLLLENKIKEDAKIRYKFLKRDIDSPAKQSKATEMFKSHITTAVEMLKKVEGYEKAINWVESLKEKIIYLLTDGQESEKYNVIIHGDCWNNNLLFRYDDEGHPVEVTLVDLQNCKKASLAYDLNYFLYTSTNGDVRNENLDTFLSIYYDSFKNVLESGGLDMFFSKNDLKEEFLDKNTAGGFYSMIVIPFVILEPVDVPDMSKMSGEDIKKFMLEIRKVAMDMVDKNPLMKPRFLSMFDDFMRTGLIT